MTIEIALAEANTLMLQALSQLFEHDKRFSVAITVKSAELFLESVLRLPVAVGVIDWTLPELGGGRLIETLRSLRSPVRMVVYASNAEPDIARRAMAAGAAAFCARESDAVQLLDVAAAAAAGRMTFPYLDVRNLARDPREDLTPRERTLLAALAKGRTNTELAHELAISINTVKFHLRNLYEKLGLENRSQAIAFYYAAGEKKA